MTYSREFLEQLANERVMGDFPPFDSGNIRAVEDYIKIIVGRLKDNYQLIVEPDYKYYGSGFASYVNVRISKKDMSDTQVTQEKNKVTNYTHGLLLYISNLTPYWFYGASDWLVTKDNGRNVSGSSGFLRPENISYVDNELWGGHLKKIKSVFDEYRYRLLTEEELEKQVDWDIQLKTVLGEKPYEVFNFLFHWED
jgi:hypothetical protein